MTNDQKTEALNALTRLSEAVQQIADNGRLMGKMFKQPILSERDNIRAHVWLHIYGAALNCEGVSTMNARDCADKGLRFYEERFLKE